MTDPPSSVYDLRETRTFDRFRNVQLAFQQNRGQHRAIPGMTQPPRREQSKTSSKKHNTNMAAERFSQVESNNVGGSMANANVPTMKASGMQGKRMIPLKESNKANT